MALADEPLLIMKYCRWVLVTGNESPEQPWNLSGQCLLDKQEAVELRRRVPCDPGKGAERLIFAVSQALTVSSCQKPNLKKNTHTKNMINI